MARSEPFAERLGLLVEAPGLSSPAVEQAVDHEVHGVKVRQLVAIDPPFGRLGKEMEQAVGREGGGQPGPGGGIGDPDSDVGVTSLVARPSLGEEAERPVDRRPEILVVG